MDVMARVRAEYWDDITNNIMYSFNHSAIAHAYSLINQVHYKFQSETVGGKIEQRGMIRRKNKTVTEHIQDAMDRWHEHFEALLNQPGQCDLQQTSRLMGKERPQDVSLGLPFTMEEIEYAINGLPDNKAYRHDG